MDNAGAAESSPTPQPNFVPFKSIASRKAQSKGVSLSTSTEQGPAADAEGIAESKSVDDDGSDEFDRDKLIQGLRELFSRGEARKRNEVIVELARQLGYRRTGSRIKQELENVIRTAVRRGILETRADKLALCAHSIGEYEREFLKEQFLSSMPSRSWADRDESIRAFARWLGFRRAGSNIEETAKSLINGLIRDARLESDGAQIRRCG